MRWITRAPERLVWKSRRTTAPGNISWRRRAVLPQLGIRLEERSRRDPSGHAAPAFRGHVWRSASAKRMVVFRQRPAARQRRHRRHQRTDAGRSPDEQRADHPAADDPFWPRRFPAAQDARALAPIRPVRRPGARQGNRRPPARGSGVYHYGTAPPLPARRSPGVVEPVGQRNPRRGEPFGPAGWSPGDGAVRCRSRSVHRRRIADLHRRSLHVGADRRCGEDHGRWTRGPRRRPRQDALAGSARRQQFRRHVQLCQPGRLCRTEADPVHCQTGKPRGVVL